MVAADEDALVCDFAETYHIYNWRGLRARYAAVLSCGLRDDSRIKMIMRKQKYTPEMLLDAAKVDALKLLVWMRTKDGLKNRNRPIPILKLLAEGKTDDNDAVMAFNTAEEFEARRKAIIEGVR